MKFILFIAAIILLGIITIKLKRKNKEITNALLSDLINSIPDVKEQKTEEVEIKKDATGDELKYTWEKLAKYIKGKEVTYSVSKTLSEKLPILSIKKHSLNFLT